MILSTSRGTRLQFFLSRQRFRQQYLCGISVISFPSKQQYLRLDDMSLIKWSELVRSLFCSSVLLWLSKIQRSSIASLKSKIIIINYNLQYTVGCMHKFPSSCFSLVCTVSFANFACKAYTVASNYQTPKSLKEKNYSTRDWQKTAIPTPLPCLYALDLSAGCFSLGGPKITYSSETPTGASLGPTLGENWAPSPSTTFAPSPPRHTVWDLAAPRAWGTGWQGWDEPAGQLCVTGSTARCAAPPSPGACGQREGMKTCSYRGSDERSCPQLDLGRCKRRWVMWKQHFGGLMEGRKGTNKLGVALPCSCRWERLWGDMTVPWAGAVGAAREGPRTKAVFSPPQRQASSWGTALGQGRHDGKGSETDSCHPASHLRGRVLCIQCFPPACFCLPLPHSPDPPSFWGCRRTAVPENIFPRECLDGSLFVGNFIAGILKDACCRVGQCCIAKLSESRQWPTLLSCVILRLVPHLAIAFFTEISPFSSWTFEISVL